MTIKAIAVDMDGTFLNSQSDYDHDYFAKVYALMVFSSWWRRVTPITN